MNKKYTAILLLAFVSSIMALPRRMASNDKKGGANLSKFALRSSAFAHRGLIPSLYTCDGQDISPELRWINVPQETKSFALVFHDPDALGGPWNHWVVINIPGHVDHLDQQVDIGSLDAIVGTNSWQEQKYSGPCPPLKEHRYIFTVYALDCAKLPLNADARRKDVVTAMQGHIIAHAEYMGRYQRIANK